MHGATDRALLNGRYSPLGDDAGDGGGITSHTPVGVQAIRKTLAVLVYPSACGDNAAHGKDHPTHRSRRGEEQNPSNSRKRTRCRSCGRNPAGVGQVPSILVKVSPDILILGDRRVRTSYRRQYA